MSYLQESGFGGQEPDPPNFNEPCMVAIGEDGEAIGLIIYDCGPENWSILLGYVLPSIDGKVSTPLFSMPFATSPRARKYLFDPFGTHPNNLAAQAAFEAQGRTKEYIMHSYPLKDRGEGKSPLRAQ